MLLCVVDTSDPLDDDILDTFYNQLATKREEGPSTGQIAEAILVGNKIDVARSQGGGEYALKCEILRVFAKEAGMQFVLVSAKTGEGVAEMMGVISEVYGYPLLLIDALQNINKDVE